mmetsp:Transcript_58665/g.166775  ORF Transcript_58665/g.166775 Transcript_58665/m.166775 type:complete len:283 (+) Transcript_58665:112-960(+)|eukprot:CAMPEP_0168416514 /NCGR_PEP_ID=MMETSP0228-20121227/30777_1 /TAXON_ID=133427 /ORGANISM="Protoceratium reticulatum, Strain CCCM 535 (=CCMP 1889)" /LENGTH=282 /DNA_ID=CAMNT_0008430337 /DNA_START=112 /DNA_END=960 /DNA_ORIENTATION=+
MGQCVQTTNQSDPALDPAIFLHLQGSAHLQGGSQPSYLHRAVLTDPDDIEVQSDLKATQPKVLLRPGAWEPRVPEPVVLNIYNLGTTGSGYALNLVLRPLGTGLFHCGVEVYGREWSYADNSQPGSLRKDTGVFCCVPCNCEGHSYTQSVQMGRTGASEAEVLRLLRLLRPSWPVEGYDTLTKNCCHFCDELCQRLGVGSVPAWAVSMADAGAAVAAHGDVTCCREVASQSREAFSRCCCRAEPEHPIEYVDRVELMQSDPDSKEQKPPEPQQGRRKKPVSL